MNSSVNIEVKIPPFGGIKETQMNYLELLQTNTRSDDYVNATKLCQTFNKELRAFSQMKETKEYVNSLASRLNISLADVMEVKRGKGGGTFVHPLLAIRLAQWLSSNFAVVVDETFKRYLDGDVSLATEVINRSTDKAAVDKHIANAQEHSQYLDSYHGLHAELKEHGCRGFHHATVNSHINQLAGVEKGQRAQMTREQKLIMMAGQAMGEVALMHSEARGWNAVATVKRASSNILG